MVAVSTKSKMPPRGSPPPRRRQTPAVSTAEPMIANNAGLGLRHLFKARTPEPEPEPEPEPMIANNSTPMGLTNKPSTKDLLKKLKEEGKVYPWSPAAEHAAAAEEAGRKSRREDDAPLPPCYQIPPCLEGCTHRWVKEPLPQLLAAKQVRA